MKWFVFKCLKRLLAIGHCDDAVPTKLKLPGDQSANLGLVVGD